MIGQSSQQRRPAGRLPVRIWVTPMISLSRVLIVIVTVSIAVAVLSNSIPDAVDRGLLLALAIGCSTVNIGLVALCISSSVRFNSRLSEQSVSGESPGVLSDMMSQAMENLKVYLEQRTMRLYRLLFFLVICAIGTAAFVGILDGPAILQVGAVGFVVLGTCWLAFEGFVYMQIGYQFLRPKIVFPSRDESGVESLNVAWLVGSEKEL